MTLTFNIRHVSVEDRELAQRGSMSTVFQEAPSSARVLRPLNDVSILHCSTVRVAFKRMLSRDAQSRNVGRRGISRWDGRHISDLRFVQSDKASRQLMANLGESTPLMSGAMRMS